MTLRRLEKSMPSADNRRANCAAQLAGADVAALKNERTRRARHHRPLTAGSAGTTRARRVGHLVRRATQLNPLYGRRLLQFDSEKRRRY